MVGINVLRLNFILSDAAVNFYIKYLPSAAALTAASEDLFTPCHQGFNAYNRCWRKLREI